MVEPSSLPFKYSGRLSPAMLKRSFSGGTDFIIPEIRLAVVEPSELPPALSQTVTLSILIFLTASTCIFTFSGNFSINSNWNAFDGSPPAAFHTSF